MNRWDFLIKKGFWHFLLKEICESLKVGGTTCKSHGKKYSGPQNAIDQKMGNIHRGNICCNRSHSHPKIVVASRWVALGVGPKSKVLE